MDVTEDLLTTMATATTEETAEEQDTQILTETTLKIIYVIIGAFGLLGNTFVVVVIFSYTGMRKQITNTYIINQSLVDATVALFLILTSLVEDDGRVFTSGLDVVFCQAWLTKMWLWGFLVSSTYNLVALTFERYLAVVHPIWHKMNFNKTKVAVSITFVWLFGIGFNMAYMVPSSGLTASGRCNLYSYWPNGETQRAVGVITIVIQYFLPLSLLSIFYVRMALVLRMRVAPEAQASGQGAKDPGKANKTDSMARARKNIIKTLALVACSFIFCWTWNQIYYLMFNLGSSLIDFTSPFYHFTVVMVFCNCCINPFIYIAKYEQFQNAMRKLFRCKQNQVTDLSS